MIQEPGVVLDSDQDGVSLLASKPGLRVTAEFRKIYLFAFRASHIVCRRSAYIRQWDSKN